MLLYDELNFPLFVMFVDEKFIKRILINIKMRLNKNVAFVIAYS
jgi:hypothetical protein